MPSIEYWAGFDPAGLVGPPPPAQCKASMKEDKEAKEANKDDEEGDGEVAGKDDHANEPAPAYVAKISTSAV